MLNACLIAHFSQLPTSHRAKRNLKISEEPGRAQDRFLFARQQLSLSENTCLSLDSINIPLHVERSKWRLNNRLQFSRSGYKKTARARARAQKQTDRQVRQEDLVFRDTPYKTIDLPRCRVDIVAERERQGERERGRGLAENAIYLISPGRCAHSDIHPNKAKSLNEESI